MHEVRIRLPGGRTSYPSSTFGYHQSMGSNRLEGDESAVKCPADTISATAVALRLQQTYPDAHCELDFDSPFQLLVATVLSAQTTDQRVNKVTPQLFARFPDAQALATADVETLQQMLRPLGMFRRRAQALHGLGLALTMDFGGQVPSTRQQLVTLPGVGRKTANVVLGNCFGREEITVDTHVGRVSRRLGWTANTNPEKVETDLWKLLPDAPWTTLCHQLIAHGRQVCFARSPQCAQCPLGDLCPQMFL